MTSRTFAEWQVEANGIRDGKTQTALANELRDRWDDWKAESGHATWDECLRAELGMSQCHVEQLVRDLSVTKNLLVRAMFV
jgi:hypothetical protein